MPDLATRTPSPPTAPATLGDPSGRSRRRWVLLVALVLAALLGAAWAVAPGVLTRPGQVTLGFEEGAPATVVDGFAGPAGAYVVGYEHDSYLDVTVAVPNRAPLGVEVVDVRPVLQDAPLLVPAEGWTPVRSGAGESATGAWRLRFDNCEAYHEREAMVVDHVEVEARVLGRAVVEQVALDRPMMVRSPMLWQCPDRTIDRQDDRRGSGAGFSRDAP